MQNKIFSRFEIPRLTFHLFPDYTANNGSSYINEVSLEITVAPFMTNIELEI